MSKLSQLSQLKAALVVGATMTVVKHSIKGQESQQHAVLNREALIVRANDLGVTYILAKPNSKSDLGPRVWLWPREEQIVSVSPTSFVMELPVDTKGGVMRFEHTVVPPRKEGQPAPDVGAEEKAAEEPAANRKKAAPAKAE